jgi:BirA family biotin operon repressor/biotin-[acetyl-CoA-carboxylase] ligase
MGLPIIRHPQQGYQLTQEFIALDEEKVRTALKNYLFISPVALHFFSSIDSTNRYLKNSRWSNQLVICCAETQTAGRGRFGRSWHSPFGKNIYCSSLWSLPCDLSKLSGLSLVVSIAIIDTLQELLDCSEIKIKWPNDLLWRGKKLCGSLIEINAESNADAEVIIGIGLNVNSDTANHPLPDKPWCSLYEITKQFHDRNQLIAHLIIRLDQYIQRFIEHNLLLFMEAWRNYDYLYGQPITITQGKEVISGIGRGINSLGLLILEDKEGKIRLCSSGDTSLNESHQVYS